MTFIEHRQQEYVGEPKIKLLSLVGDMDVMTPFRKQTNTGQSPRQLRLETLGAGTGCTALLLAGWSLELSTNFHNFHYA